MGTSYWWLENHEDRQTLQAGLDLIFGGSYKLNEMKGNAKNAD